MSELTLRRMVWGGLAIWTVTFWALAIIGAQSLIQAPECPSVWDGVKAVREGRR